MARHIHPRELYAQGCIRNAVSLTETAFGWLPSRFTENQLNVYAEQENHKLRSECPAGIALDLMTDSPWLELDCTITGYVRKYAYLDVFLGDSRFGTFPCATAGETSRSSMRIMLPESPDGKTFRRVTVYLPHCAVMHLAELRLEELAEWSAAPVSPRKLLSLGDSITQGMDARYPSSAYPVRLARRWEMEVLNQGVGGYFYNERVLDGSLPWHPDLITIAYGTNDWTRSDSLEQFADACRAFYDKLALLYPGIPVIAWTPLWRADWEQPRKAGGFGEIAAVMKETTGAYGQVRLLDGLELIEHRPEWFQDGLHPTDDGFERLTANLLARL